MSRLVFPVRRKEPVVLTFVNRCPAAIRASVSADVSSSCTMATISFIRSTAYALGTFTVYRKTG